MAAPSIPDVLLVLDRAAARRLAPRIGRVGGGRAALLLRDPAATARELLLAAREIRPWVDRLLVSDRPDVALLAEADGVHLPERGLSPADVGTLLGDHWLIGASRHDAAGVAAAFASGAHYVTLSPIWASPGKGPPLGPEGLRPATRDAPGPVLALGGVDETRIAQAVRAGARGVAVVRAMTGAADPERALLGLLASLDAARRDLLDPAR